MQKWGLRRNTDKSKTMLFSKVGKTIEDKFEFVVNDTEVEYEPRHDKTNKVTMRPAKTQISLGIRPV